MDIYSNPKQKQKDHVPEEFLCESRSSSDESSEEEELQPPQTEDEAPPQTKDEAPPLTLEQSDNQKNGKRKKNSPESTSAPHNKQPRQERLATPRPPNPKPSTSSGILRTTPNTSSQEQRRPSISSEFQWTAPNTYPKKNAGHLQSYTEAGMILRRSQTYSHQNGSKINSKKRNLDSKPTARARLKIL